MDTNQTTGATAGSPDNPGSGTVPQASGLEGGGRGDFGAGSDAPGVTDAAQVGTATPTSAAGQPLGTGIVAVAVGSSTTTPANATNSLTASTTTQQSDTDLALTSVSTAWPIFAQIKPLLIPDGVNHWKGRAGHYPLAVCYHITESDDIGSVDGWFHNPDAEASAHFGIDRDGSIHQYVVSGDTAWSNGNIRNPNGGWIEWLQECIAKQINPNYRTISIEHVGHYETGITELQFQATVALSNYLLHRYGILPERRFLVRHSDFDTVTRPNCPGQVFPLQRIIDTLAKIG